MKAKTIFVLITLIIVAVVLAGGTAFILQQNKLTQMKRQATSAEEKIAAKEYDEAIPILKQIEAKGGSARGTYLLGKAYWEQDKLSEAMAYFRKIEEKYPRSEFVPDAMLYRGRYVLEVEGQPKDANEIFLQLLERHSESQAADHALYYLSKAAYDEGNIQQARKGLEQIVRKAESPAKDQAEFLLGDMNMKQLKSPEPGPGDEVYTIKKGDSLWKLQRQLNVPMDLITGINNLNPNALTVGTQIKVPRLNLSVIIDKPQRMLTIKNNNSFLKKYRVGIHQLDNRVPAGDYTVTAKFEKGYEYLDPDTNQSFKVGDPNNPLGSRYIQLRRDLGIHGTNNEEVVGTYTSKGWISMTNSDVEEVYTLLQEKTPVTIRGKNMPEGSAVER